MSNSKNTYYFKENESDGEIMYFFISKGKADIDKAVQYSFVRKLGDRKLYNLGFGDYDYRKKVIRDDVNTNNGDAYKVFNTVLSTIVAFFERCKNDILTVEGSNSTPEFADQCRLTCSKNCAEECRKVNRRINIYCNYLNKHYEQLISDYQFLGEYFNEANEIEFENYVCGKKYSAIFLLKRNP